MAVYDFSNAFKNLNDALTGAGDTFAAVKRQKAGDDDFRAASQMPGGLYGSAQPVAAGTVQAAAAPAASAPLGNAGQIETRFMGAAREAGLNSPFGLAALAATGQRESGWSPSKANATWSDPSQSGQPGTSGGILSWRGPRLQAMYKFAQSRGEQPGNISPETQALFAFQEDPTLVHRLNGAKTAEDANRVMAQAWRYAGYDGSGPEYRARLKATNQYLARYNGQGGAQPTQVAQADTPAQGSQPAQGFAVPGQPRQGEISPETARRWIADMDARMARGNMSKVQMEAVQRKRDELVKYADPMRVLDMRSKELAIRKAEGELNGTGRVERGLTPQFGVDANGNPVMIQIGKDGTAVQTQMPDGVSLSKEPLRIDAGTHTVLLDPVTRQQIGLIPKNLGAAEAEKVTGKAQGEAMTALPKAIGQAQGMLDTIKKVREHPGRDSWGATGASSTWPIIGQGIPNTQGRDFVGLVNQMQGQAFLAAFESLKGSGVITDIEGKKATDAIARLDRAQTKAGFDAALKDLEEVAQAGIDRAMKQARSGGPAPQAVGQPQQGASSVAAPSVAIRALRANPSLAADFDAKYGQGMAAQILR